MSFQSLRPWETAKKTAHARHQVHVTERSGATTPPHVLCLQTEQCGFPSEEERKSAQVTPGTPGLPFQEEKMQRFQNRDVWKLSPSTANSSKEESASLPEQFNTLVKNEQEFKNSDLSCYLPSEQQVSSMVSQSAINESAEIINKRSNMKSDDVKSTMSY